MPSPKISVVPLLMAFIASGSSLCTDDACSAACNLVDLNNSTGSCDGNFVNDKGESSCICNDCPPGTMLDVFNPNVFNGTCLGPPISELKGCTACPPSGLPISGNYYFPHFCTVDSQQFCVCMCVPALGILTQCPFQALFG